MKTKEDLKKIKYLVIDVDGTLTDSGIYYDDNGNEMKRFSTRDAAGFFVAHQVGIKTIVLTGRKCEATTRRMKELKVDFLVQNCRDKVHYLDKFMKDNEILREEIGYIGDDLNDLLPMEKCGFIGCPLDACDEIKDSADYVSNIKGGYGAVRDVISFILKERDEWEEAYRVIYSSGI